MQPTTSSNVTNAPVRFSRFVPAQGHPFENIKLKVRFPPFADIPTSTLSGRPAFDPLRTFSRSTIIATRLPRLTRATKGKDCAPITACDFWTGAVSFVVGSSGCGALPPAAYAIADRFPFTLAELRKIDFIWGGPVVKRPSVGDQAPSLWLRRTRNARNIASPASTRLQPLRY